MAQDLRTNYINEVMFGFFMDQTDGTTERNSETIANTDFRLHKYRASAFVNKNSGGASFISVATYLARFDSTDVNTPGPMQVFIHKTSCLPVKMEFNVLTEAAWVEKYSTGLHATISMLTSVQTVVDSILGTVNSVKAMTSNTYTYGALTSQLTSVQAKADSVAVVLGSLYASLTVMSNLSAAAVWAVSTRSLTDSVARASQLTSVQTVVDLAARTSQLTSVQTNVDLTSQRANSILVSLGALNNITADSVWAVATRSLTDSVARTSQLTSVQTAVDLIHGSMAIQSTLLSVQAAVDAGAAGITTSQIWEYASRTLTEIDSVIALQSTLLSVQTAVDAGAAGITTSQIWEYTNRALTDSIARISQLTSVQLRLDTAAGSIAALNNLTADSVWAVATRSLTDSVARASQLTSVQGKADSIAVVLGSLYASLAVMSNLSAADMWAVGTRALTDSVARASQLTSVQTNVDSILGTVNSVKAMTSQTYVYGALTSQVTSVQTNVDLALQRANSILVSLAALNNLTADSVWAVGTRSLTDSVARTSQLTSVQIAVDAGAAGITTSQIWEYTSRTLTDSLIALQSTLLSVQIGLGSVSGGGDATLSAQSTIIAHLEGIKGPTWAVATDSLEAIRDRGDVAWLTGGGMAGANAVTLTIQDGSGNNIVEAAIEVYDSAGTTFYEKKLSNSSGQAVYQMDDGTYIIKAHKAGYSFTDTTLVVSGATAETITGSAVVIAPPADPDLCRVAIYLKFADGTIPAEVENWISITRLPEVNDNVALSAIAEEGIYDASTGLLYWDIIQGATVKVFVKDFGIQKQITVPATATAELEDLI